MKSLGAALNGVDQSHRREVYSGTIQAVGNGGKTANVNNASNQRDLDVCMPYGISSSAPSGMKAQVVNTDSNSNSDAVVGVFDSNRPSVASGDVMMYSRGGAKVHCKGGVVLLNSRNVLGLIDGLIEDVETINGQIADLTERIIKLETATQDIGQMDVDLDTAKADIIKIKQQLGIS